MEIKTKKRAKVARIVRDLFAQLSKIWVIVKNTGIWLILIPASPMAVETMFPPGKLTAPDADTFFRSKVGNQNFHHRFSSPPALLHLYKAGLRQR